MIKPVVIRQFLHDAPSCALAVLLHIMAELEDSPTATVVLHRHDFSRHNATPHNWRVAISMLRDVRAVVVRQTRHGLCVSKVQAGQQVGLIPGVPVPPEVAEKDADLLKRYDTFIDVFKTSMAKHARRSVRYGRERKAIANFKAWAKGKSIYTPDDIVRAIRHAISDKYHQESNYKYLTPEYILRPDILARYVNAVPVVSPDQAAQPDLFKDLVNP